MLFLSVSNSNLFFFANFFDIWLSTLQQNMFCLMISCKKKFDGILLFDCWLIIFFEKISYQICLKLISILSCFNNSSTVFIFFIIHKHNNEIQLFVHVIFCK